MATNTMTMRTFLNALINGTIGEGENATSIFNVAEDGTISLASEFTAYASAEVAKLNAKNAKRRSTQSKAQAENEGIKTAIVAFMVEGEVYTASALATEFGISTQKVSALMAQLVKANEVAVSDVKVKGKGKVKGYSLPSAEVEGEGEGDGETADTVAEDVAEGADIEDGEDID